MKNIFTVYDLLNTSKKHLSIHFYSYCDNNYESIKLAEHDLKVLNRFKRSRKVEF